MKKFDAVLYMLPVPNGEFENVVNPNTKAIIHRNPKYDHTPVYAIVLDIHPQENEDPLIDVAFLHPAKAGALSGADWREAFERVFAVRHVDHDDVGDNFAMGHYRELPTQEAFESYRAFKNQQVEELRAELANTTEGRDKALQALADAGNRPTVTVQPGPGNLPPGGFDKPLPSAADLDAVAEEQQAKEQTS
jgi:hypothetical protein